MGPPSLLYEFEQKIASLWGQPALSHAGFLREVGTYFYQSEPREIDKVYVLEFAPYINNLYIQMADAGEFPRIIESILEVLGKVNTQCEKISNDKLDDEYFINFKRLGRALIKISDFIEKNSPSYVE